MANLSAAAPATSSLSESEISRLCEASSEKLEQLRTRIRGFGSALIAFSGGVDSTFVLKIAVE
jgi:uncharacterized protein